MNSKKWFILLAPIVIAASVALGIYLGNSVVIRSNGSILRNSNSVQKISDVISLIQNQYVDDVNIDSISEESISKLLGTLDPHSTYISAEDLREVNNELNGSFCGIGVQFNIQSDTIMVVAVINGGPSEKLGILPGDRIVKVNDSAFVGKKLSNELVQKTLRGECGTKVKLGIKRASSKKILNFTVVRGDIPLKSVDTYYMLNKNIGYIKVGVFGAQTHREFLMAIAELKTKGATKFVVDLRCNSGGYLEAATNMINEFLTRGDLIVYTEGKEYDRQNVYADGSGCCLNNPIAVLIDEWSASASEIFAGAIQDNDRGLIIGRRSFGKGLVQQQYPLSDQSAIRLTVARYYTPSGRCIQKPYSKGDNSDYEMDIVNRFLHGEFSSKDSIDLSKNPEFKTKKGRTVYGGGGIMADIFIPRDTVAYTPYFNKVTDNGYIYEYAFRYTDQNRSSLSKFKNWKDLLSYLQKASLLKSFTDFAKEKGVEPNMKQILISSKKIENTLHAYIIRDILGDDAFYQVFQSDDKCIGEAIKQLNKKH